MYGLKNVRSRRDDELTRVGWEQLESLLAIYYRGQGYQVEHCGTGGTRARFDGGIDLKLRRDDQYIIVQCKHWNAKQVPHNAVHELLGIMVNQGATGAILITSGEFTKAAIEAATRQGHVQLIDGEELRAMIGPVAEPDVPHHGFQSANPPASTAWPVVIFRAVLPLVFAAVVASFVFREIKHVFAKLTPVVARTTAHLPVTAPVEQGIANGTASTKQPRDAPSIASKPSTVAERLERKRQDDEAMRALKEGTPEM